MDRDFAIVLALVALAGVLLVWASEREDAFRDRCKAQAGIVLKTSSYGFSCVRIPGAVILEETE